MGIRFPVFVDLSDNNCTVIGGGEYAAAAAEMLLRFGAKVTVISPLLCDRLRALDEQKKIRYIPRKFFRGDCANAYLCVAATDVDSVNVAVSVECKSRGIPVNVKSPAAYGTFRLPVVAVYDDLVAAAYSDSPENEAALAHLAEIWRTDLSAAWHTAKQKDE